MTEIKIILCKKGNTIFLKVIMYICTNTTFRISISDKYYEDKV